MSYQSRHRRSWHKPHRKESEIEKKDKKQYAEYHTLMTKILDTTAVYEDQPDNPSIGRMSHTKYMEIAKRARVRRDEWQRIFTLVNPRTNEPRAHIFKLDGFGYIQDSGISLIFYVE